MSAELFRVLASMTIATSIAVTLVTLLRKPVRVAAGARVAYWLWLLVPAMAVAVLLPAPKQDNFIRTVVLPKHISSAMAVAVTGRVTPDRRATLIDIALALWGAGLITAGVLTITRQRKIAPILGEMILDAGGFHRANVTTPMVVGALHPKIVVPMDFEARYSQDERELILAHERAHGCRHDVAVNLLASLALCVFWFNPLLYAALVWLRMDQELACDAHVLHERGDSRRPYAEALLKTQLATQFAWQLSVGCHWQSIHPLKERVAMLKRPLPASSRRLVGLALIMAFTGIMTYATWAGQPAVASGPSILVDYDIRITNVQRHELREVKTAYLVKSGETIKDEGDGLPLLKLPLPKVGSLRIGCTPYLADAPGRSTDWSAQKARGTPIPAAGQILLDCPILHDGAMVQRPNVITDDGKMVTLEGAEPDGSYQFRLQITASTSPDKIAAAKSAGESIIAAKQKARKQ